jgi:hypothetical protein
LRQIVAIYYNYLWQKLRLDAENDFAAFSLMRDGARAVGGGADEIKILEETL